MQSIGGNDMAKHLLILFALAVALAGCSVSRAAKHEGAKLDEYQNCSNRNCFLAYNVEVMNREDKEDGTFVETYRAKIDKGSAGRAVMHGLLDVVTIGLWEIAGTPIEGSKAKKNTIILEVEYDADESVKHVVLR